jgi:hypothetical protein
MLKSRLLTGTLVTAAVVVASLFAAAPANAATLPSGQKITIIGQYDDQFYNVSPADASLTPVGNFGEQIDFCTTSVDVDDSGIGYALASWSTPDCTNQSAQWDSGLFNADANTGTLTGGVEVTIMLGEETFESADECTSIDYTAGIVRGICFIYGDVGETAYVGTIDPTTGVLVPTIEPLTGDDFLYFTAMALDPISGIMYAFALSDGSALYTLSEADGAQFVVDLDGPAWGADFDRGGQLWINVRVYVSELESDFPGIATIDTTTGFTGFFEAYTLGGDVLEEDFSAALTVWGAAPVLPATGPAQTVPLGVGAAIFLLLGSFLAAVTITRQRRREAGA